jgi:hypothetical protein
MENICQTTEAAAVLLVPTDNHPPRKRSVSQIDRDHPDDTSYSPVLKRLKIAASNHFKPQSVHSKKAAALLAQEDPRNATTSQSAAVKPPLSTIPPERPNTKPLFQLIANRKENFNSKCPLRIDSFIELLDDYPNPEFPKLLAEVIQYGAKIGYAGPSDARARKPNHPSARLNTQAISDEIAKELSLGRLRKLPRLPQHYYCSPLGLVPKTSDGKQTGWRRIFDLSSPKGNSVNDYIDTAFGYLRYETFDEAVLAVAKAGRNAVLLKRDLKSAFRMIPYAPKISGSLFSNGKGNSIKNSFYLSAYGRRHLFSICSAKPSSGSYRSFTLGRLSGTLTISSRSFRRIRRPGMSK